MNVLSISFAFTSIISAMALKPILETNRQPYTVINVAQESDPEQFESVKRNDFEKFKLNSLISASLQNVMESQNLLNAALE